MPANAVSRTGGVKVCSHCGVDVSARKRFKNSNGEYFCENCSAAATAAPSTTTPAPAVTPPTYSVPADAAHIRFTPQLFGLVSKVTCPHCWNVFAPQDCMWIAAHNDLVGDTVLGPEAASRFVPTRFTVDGMALDSRGTACGQLACPRCHLPLPRSLLEAEPLILSIIGGPTTGKSYFLAAMTWELRRRLPGPFLVSFNDADAEGNLQLTEAEGTLFLPDDPTEPVALTKTEVYGHIYSQAMLDGNPVLLPRPYLFNVRPAPQHPHASQAERISRVLCLYDNAGESFQPGKDSSKSPVTQHLAKAKLLMFLFDPVQDSRFREKCRKVSSDPQLSEKRSQRQETLLIEATTRVRRHANLPPSKKYDKPLMILVPKSDVWGQLLHGEDLQSEPIIAKAINGQIGAVDVARIERVSDKLRQMLLNDAPEIVSAAEDFCTQVLYVPVSALGHSPESRPLPGESEKMGLFIRPDQISPHWVSVPVLYMFAKWTTGLIAGNAPAGRRSEAARR